MQIQIAKTHKWEQQWGTTFYNKAIHAHTSSRHDYEHFSNARQYLQPGIIAAMTPPTPTAHNNGSALIFMSYWDTKYDFDCTP
jgi:hypothetical protein